MAFWDTLEEIAATQNMSLAKFVTTLHDEVLDHHGEVKNFASLLRCSCLIYRARSMQAVAEFHQAATPILDAAEQALRLFAAGKQQALSSRTGPFSSLLRPSPGRRWD
jgi:predicted DNA-binding ribbon-helix-helix protein